MHFEFEKKNPDYYQIAMILSKKVPMHFDFREKNINDFQIASEKNPIEFQIAIVL